MKVQEAITKAFEDEGVKGLKDYFLASVFSILEKEGEPKEWTLLFYKSGKTVDVFVGEKVTIGQELPAQKEMKKLEWESVKVDIADAVKTAKSKCSKPFLNILISLHTMEHVAWNITFVCTDLTAMSYEIDAVTGEIKKEKSANLMRREK